jgi:hypothetical protein
MTELLERARAWIAEVHPHALHLERTLHWLVVLAPGAGEAARIAAVTHDAERAFPDPGSPWVPSRDFDVPDYTRWHQDRCADLVSAWLREQGGGAEVVQRVDALVRAHEDGGWPEADLVQAADSLSFLEVMVPLVEGWVADGRASPERAAHKLQTMDDRISPDLPRARELARPLLDDGLARVASVAEPR